MRLSTLVKLLALGGGATAIVVGNRRMKSRRVDDREDAPDDIPDEIYVSPDPNDAVQALDEVDPFHVEELEVDARSVEDLAEEGIHPIDSEVGLDEVPTVRETPHQPQGGDLYGVHTPAASDRAVLDGDSTMATGQNWLEALETSSAENGPLPEGLVDIVDDEELDHPPTDNRDIPIADRGSAGPRGL
jgi:hypothetical protein